MPNEAAFSLRYHVSFSRHVLPNKYKFFIFDLLEVCNTLILVSSGNSISPAEGIEVSMVKSEDSFTAILELVDNMIFGKLVDDGSESSLSFLRCKKEQNVFFIKTNKSSCKHE